MAMLFKKNPKNSSAGPLCSRCLDFLNRPVQTDGVLFSKDKVLLLHKTYKVLEDIHTEHFIGKYLGKIDISQGFYTLPGHLVRMEETIEESVVKTFYEETGIKTKIDRVVGVYSDPNRDLRSHGVSVAFGLKRAGGRLRKHRLWQPEWHNLEKLPKPIIYDHQKMIKGALAKRRTPKVHLEALRAIHPKVYTRKLKRTPEGFLCPRCGQFACRPAQVDGILVEKGKILLIKRRRRFLNSKLNRGTSLTPLKGNLPVTYQAGFYVLPGGYVRRNQSIEEALVTEFYEETGIRVKPKRLVGIFSDLDRDPKSGGISFLYQVEWVAGKGRPSAEAVKVGWHKIDQLPQKIGFDHRRMIRAFIKT
jgi:ADP-ribose pyrophosphatase YjhB (NUDIX family)